jgi:nitroreductase
MKFATCILGSCRHMFRDPVNAFMEAGHAAENLMLQAAALGLAATMVGAFDDDDVRRLLHLAPEQTPLCLLPTGTP